MVSSVRSLAWRQLLARSVVRVAQGEEPPPFARGDRGEVFHCTGRSDGMVAVYPGGRASYGAHLDNVDGDGRDDSIF